MSEEAIRLSGHQAATLFAAVPVVDCRHDRGLVRWTFGGGMTLTFFPDAVDRGARPYELVIPERGN